MKRNGNAKRRRRENRVAEGAERGGVWGGGITLPIGRGAWGEGRAPSPEIFLLFCLAMVHFGAFWAVVLMLVYIRRVKQSRKAVLCANCQLLVSYLTWRISESAVSQSDTNAAYTGHRGLVDLD